MAAIIAVIGNSAAGKTTLANALASRYGFHQAIEEHHTRPFQALMTTQTERYACLNQIDYLLFRAEQQRDILRGSHTGVIDGGLDEDFHLFTRLFLQRSYINQEEFLLCTRLYRQLKESLPPITLSIFVDTPVDLCIQRYRERNRTLEVAKTADLHTLDGLLKEWLGQDPPKPMIKIDGSLPLDVMIAQTEFALKSYRLIT